MGHDSGNRIVATRFLSRANGCTRRHGQTYGYASRHGRPNGYATGCAWSHELPAGHEYIDGRAGRHAGEHVRTDGHGCKHAGHECQHGQAGGDGHVTGHGRNIGNATRNGGAYGDASGPDGFDTTTAGYGWSDGHATTLWQSDENATDLSKPYEPDGWDEWDGQRPK